MWGGVLGCCVEVVSNGKVMCSVEVVRWVVVVCYCDVEC